MTADPEPEFMLAVEVASLFRVTPAAVRKLARKGEIPAVRLGHLWRFPRADILALSKDHLRPKVRELESV